MTCVHKANILKMSDGLFLSIFNEIAKEYPEIEYNDKIIGNDLYADGYESESV